MVGRGTTWEAIRIPAIRANTLSCRPESSRRISWLIRIPPRMKWSSTRVSSSLPDYQGDGFAAEHGSWNRKPRGGYEVIRLPMHNGHATGEYEDFLTGFVLPDGKVWGAR